MKLYLFLLSAIVFEVLGTMLLPATNNFSKMLPSIISSCSYIISFYFLSLTVGKLPLAIVYSTWAGLGVFTVAFLSYFIYQQHLRWQSVIGLFLIVIGVVIVNLYKEQL
jgi:small multidrug resistance pump